MEILTLNNTTYNKNQYQKVIDTSFTQLVQPQVTTIASTISVEEFFQDYQILFYQIPKFGEINSHEYLIKTSKEYIDDTGLPDDITQALTNEINLLRQENLELQLLQPRLTIEDLKVQFPSIPLPTLPEPEDLIPDNNTGIIDEIDVEREKTRKEKRRERRKARRERRKNR